jgi:peptidyl-dipeptidase Dcp
MKETNKTLDNISITTALQPGDLAYVVYSQAKLYSNEYDYGIPFESYALAGMHEFYENYNPAMDRVWVCKDGDKIIGFLLLMHRENNAAQLRYFYIEPEYRGIGLGKKMLQLYMDFLTEKGYRSSYLWTTHELDSAISLYKRHGFTLTQQKQSMAFGKLLNEQRYDLSLVEG